MQPAQTLAESALVLQQKELDYGSPLYTDLCEARGTDELTELKIFLRNFARVPKAYAKAAFVGNRGSGKSTYLLHLEHELEQERLFTPLHFFLDQSLEADCNYSDVLFWMVQEIADQFAARGYPVAENALVKVTEWFAEKTLERTTDWKKEFAVEAKAEASIKYGLPGLAALKLLASLRSMLVGSETSRESIREKLQNYSAQLLDCVNEFLDQARAALEKAGKPSRLLIVVDNLDRLDGKVARPLFEKGGEMLTGIASDIIYTAPLALNLAPFSIERLFSYVCTMPNVKVRLRNGTRHQAGIEGLISLVRHRLAIDRIFENEKVLLFLIEKSGGSLRDLLRLLDSVQLKAQAEEKTRVDMAVAKAAVKKRSLEFSRFLKPGNVYYPILAEIHATKQEFKSVGGTVTVESVEDARAFFADLIGNGSVLEYNGDDSWYDVHPALCDLQQFKDACKPTSRKKK